MLGIACNTPGNAGLSVRLCRTMFNDQVERVFDVRSRPNQTHRKHDQPSVMHMLRVIEEGTEESKMGVVGSQWSTPLVPIF